VTSIRAERGYTTSVVLLCGHDIAADKVMFQQRSRTDEILMNLPVWPDGLAIKDVQLTTKTQLSDMINAIRNLVMTLSVDFHDALDFHTEVMKFLTFLTCTLKS